MGFHIVEAPEVRLAAGDRLEYRLRLFGIPVRWKTRILRLDPGRGFVDEQVEGPYRSWIHTHWFESSKEGATLMEDRVDYRLPSTGRAPDCPLEYPPPGQPRKGFWRHGFAPIGGPTRAPRSWMRSRHTFPASGGFIVHNGSDLGR